MGDEPLWLHCCPWWLVRQPAIQEAGEYASWAEQGNLPAFFEPGMIPVGLKNAIRSFNAGYNTGMEERVENDRKNRN